MKKEHMLGVTFYLPFSLFQRLKNLSHQKQISTSELIRDSINFYLFNQRCLKELESIAPSEKSGIIPHSGLEILDNGGANDGNGI